MKISRTCQRHPQKKVPYHISEQGHHAFAVSYHFSCPDNAQQRIKKFCDIIAEELETDGGIIGHIKMICTETTEKRLSYTTNELKIERIDNNNLKVKGVAILLTEKGEHLPAIMEHAFTALM